MFTLFNTSGLHMGWPSADVMPIDNTGMVDIQPNVVPGYYAAGILNPNPKSSKSSQRVNEMLLSASERGAACLNCPKLHK
jgi:hypothetical protein